MMQDAIITVAAQVIGTLLMTLIGVLGAWLLAKIGKRQELNNIKIAVDDLTELAQQTVYELQQTMVEELKAKAADGKLTDEEIGALGVMLLEKTKKKMSEPAINLLEAAGVDINAIIRGAGEALIDHMHQFNK